MKEVSKLYNEIVLSDNQNTIDEFNPANGSNGYASFEDPANGINNGGFRVELDVANKFSPCGGSNTDQRCKGLPNENNWLNINHTNDLNYFDNADSLESWDRIVDRGQRNNKNTRSNIPYYYFGITPGKTAIDKLNREFFVG
jgi:hypothetical protein